MSECFEGLDSRALEEEVEALRWMLIRVIIFTIAIITTITIHNK